MLDFELGKDKLILIR